MRDKLPECGAMGLCHLPLGHDGQHETTVDRAIAAAPDRPDLRAQDANVWRLIEATVVPLIAGTKAEVDAANDALRRVRIALAAPVTDATLDVGRLGYRDLLNVAEAILTKYPPDTIVCSHDQRADIGARTIAAISDLIESSRQAEKETA